MGIMNIVSDNLRLGLRTVFFYGDESILAYTENKKIYINERTSADIELINKHEVLHHYENSAYFEKIKKIFLDALSSEDLKKLRNEYMIKYHGLYSIEVIEQGIIDTEIAIDLIIGNSPLKKFDADEVVEDAYYKIVSSSRVSDIDKRYNSLKK